MHFLNNPIVVLFILTVWGFMVKYSPWLKAWPNRLIPLMNLVLAILAKLAAGEPAHPGFLSDLGWGSPLVLAIVQQCFYQFVKPILAHFGITGSPTPASGRFESHRGEVA